MSAGSGQSMDVTFQFRKRADGEIEVHGFREAGQSVDRLIDPDLRPLAKHPALNTEDIRLTLLSVSTTKRLVVSLPDAVYRQYANGDYSQEHDSMLVSNPASATRSQSAQTIGGRDGGEAERQRQRSQERAPEQGDVAQAIAAMMARQQAFMVEQSNNQLRMMAEITSALGSLATFSRTKKMEVTKFDGINNDARTWMLLYERACESNGWMTDEQRINNLKANLVPGSGADRWFSSRILQASDPSWDEWKESFVTAFSQNRIDSCRRALHWEYRSGSVMNYFYEKERLLQLAFPHLHEDTFVTLVIFGLPSYMHAQVLASKPSSKDELISTLQTLVPRKEAEQVKKKDDKRPPQPTQSTSGQGARPQPSPRSRPNQTGQGGGTQASGQQRQINNIGNVLPVYNVCANGITVRALFDSGADVDAVAEQVVRRNRWTMTPSPTSVSCFDSTVVSSPGTVTVDVVLPDGNPIGPGARAMTEALVMQGMPYDLIISEPTLRKLGIGLAFIGSTGRQLESATADDRISCLADVERLFPELLNDTMEPRVEVDFALRDPCLITAQKPYRLSRDRAEKVAAEIESQLERGLIRHSHSLFAAPVVPVVKPNGSIRLCQDYRLLNANTDLDPFPMPFLDDIIVNLGGCEWFTKIDLRDAFRQIGLTERTRHLTAFVSATGHHVEHTRLPFGYKNSPPIFQRHITHVLGSLLHDPRVSCYVDDIVCGAKTQIQNEQLAYQICSRLSSHGMIINPDKSCFNQQSVELLGRIIDGQQRTTKLESIAKVRNMHRPVDVRTVQQFTGLTNHFRDFIPQYASIVRPIDRLKRKDEPFVWSAECEKAFQTLVTIITSDPILALPDWTLDFELCTDASNYGCGGILYQKDPSKPKRKQMRVIGYYSHTFTAAECNYCVSEKEMLAVIKAIKYFRSYLEGRRFTVHSDHQALSSVMGLKEPKGRLSRWQVFLMSYDMKINHRKGTDLKDADAISRLCLDRPPMINAVLLAKPLLSQEDKRLILSRYHDDPGSGGHDGIARTYYKLKPRFGNQWPGLKKDVDDYIRSCHVCQITKFKYRQKPDFLVLAPHSTSAYEVCHLDFAEIKKKSEGCKTTRSFIILVDEFTRMVHTRAIRETSRSVIAFLESLPFLTAIKRLVTDNGPAFVSKEFRKWAQGKIILTNTSLYHPASNGLAERKVQDVKAFIKRYDNFAGGWKACLSAATRHINRSFHASIGCTPFFMAHGQSDPFPADHEFSITDLPEEKPLTQEQQIIRRQAAQASVNDGKRRPCYADGDEILFCRGDRGVAHGPVTVKKVIEKQGVAKTLICEDEGSEKAIAVGNATRYHRRPMISAFSLSVLLLALVPKDCLAALIRESPLLWDTTKIPVLGGQYTYKHKIVFADPCANLTHVDLLNALRDRQKTALADWCRLKMRLFFWEPIKTICQKKETALSDSFQEPRSNRIKGKNRGKRFIIETLAVIVIISTVVLIAGIATSAYFKARSNEQAIAAQNERLREIREENLKHHHALKFLTADLKNVSTRLKQLEYDFETLLETLPAFTTTIAETNNVLYEWKRNTQLLVRDWQMGHVSEIYYDMFNMTHFVQPGSVTAEGTPIKCSYNEAEGLVEFMFSIPVARADSKIMKANPFILYHNATSRSNQTANCKFVYTGPKYAILSDCVHTLDHTEEPTQTSAYVLPHQKKCLEPPREAEPMYAPTECNTKAEPLAQIKFTRAKSFIYCPGRLINIEERVIACPDYVFSLPRSAGFSLDTFNYSSHESVVTESNFQVLDSFRVGSVVYPAAGHEQLDLAPGLDKLLADLEDEPETRWNDLPGDSLLVAILLTIIGTVSVIACDWLCCRYRPWSRGRPSTRTPKTSGGEAEAMPMRAFVRSSVPPD